MSETSSAARAAVNRDNAQKSTGPVTEAGKRISSLNALRHGLTGQTVVMPNEDLAAYQRFSQSLHEDMKPVGALEIQLAQSLADDAWRLNRAKAIETNLLAIGLHRNTESTDADDPAVRDALAIAEALHEQTKALATLSLHQNRIARTFERNLTQFRQIQEERRLQERRDLNTAAILYQGHLKLNKKSGSNEPFHPADLGFVLTTAQIELFLRRQTLIHADWPGPLFERLAA
jgi:hypothetical protein